MLALNVNPTDNTPEARDLEFSALRYLGVNGVNHDLSADDLARGLRFGSTGASIWHMGPQAYAEPDLEKMDNHVAAAAKDFLQQPRPESTVHCSLMDEAGATALEVIAKSELSQKQFRVFLEKEGQSPETLGVADWDAVKLRADRAGGRLYYWSQRFRAWQVAEFFRLATETVHRHFPPYVKTTQNFSDGAVYMANFYLQGNDYYTWFKNGALDIAMSEDWTNGGATGELCGWNVALLRSATKYHHQPIHMYDITSFGRRPLDVKLKAYSDLAQGAKMLHFYSYNPVYAGHEPGWYQNWMMYPAVAEVCHEIGAAEDVLLDAMPRRAQAAMIYSIPYDIWSVVGVDNLMGMERMTTYLALRHAQVAVDVVSNDDVREGLLKPYRVAYLMGEQIDKRDVEPLTNWVRAGGTLVLLPGAASRNEFNQPMDDLDQSLHLKRGPVKTFEAYQRSSLYLNLLKPHGQINLADGTGSTGTAEVLGRHQDLPDGGEPLGATFEDGKPAAASYAVGAGRVVLVGFMPGLDYMYRALEEQKHDAEKQTAAPLDCVAVAMKIRGEAGVGKPGEPLRVPRAQHTANPLIYDSALRQFIVAPMRLPLPGEKTSPEAIEASHPLVEATLMEGSQGWAVPLANYSGSKIDEITLTIRVGTRDFGSIYTARQGKVEADVNHGVATVKLPLESTDIVYATWEKPGPVD
jgi:hypothetical protein